MSFHVPERRRVVEGRLASTFLAGQNGAFELESPENGWRLGIIASDSTDAAAAGLPAEACGWEHVSVLAFRGPATRTPNWREMCHVKELFWDPDDVVMQLHPRRSEYVNNHPHVLHLWRHKTREIPTPPPILVGVVGVGPQL